GDHTLFTADGDRLLSALSAAGAKEGTGTKAGVYHLDQLPGLEFRVGGYKPGGKVVKQVQSVVPPTPGTDGTPRTWKVSPRTPVAPLPEAAYVFLEGIAAGNQHRQPPPRQPEFLAKVTTRRDAQIAYARAGLRDAAAQVARATKGARHDLLRDLSLPIAGFVKAGVLTEEEFLAAFLEADRLNGHAADDPGDADVILKSALVMATARDLSEIG